MTAYVPVERLQGLVERWREPRSVAGGVDFEDGMDRQLENCADELQAVLSQAVEVDDAVMERVREIAYRDEAKSVTVRADDLRALIAAMGGEK